MTPPLAISQLDEKIFMDIKDVNNGYTLFRIV